MPWIRCRDHKFLSCFGCLRSDLCVRSGVGLCCTTGVSGSGVKESPKVQNTQPVVVLSFSCHSFSCHSLVSGYPSTTVSRHSLYCLYRISDVRVYQNRDFSMGGHGGSRQGGARTSVMVFMWCPRVVACPGLSARCRRSHSLSICLLSVAEPF